MWLVSEILLALWTAGLPLLRCVARFAFHEVGELDLKRGTQPAKRFEGRIALSTFDLRQIGRGQISLEGQVFLGHSALFPFLPDPRANPLFESCDLPMHGR